jgi:hypothetical protein
MPVTLATQVAEISLGKQFVRLYLKKKNPSQKWAVGTALD